MEITLTRSETYQIIDAIKTVIDYCIKMPYVYQQRQISIEFMDIFIGVIVRIKNPTDEYEDGEVDVDIQCIFYVKGDPYFKLTEYICADLWNCLDSEIGTYVNDKYDYKTFNFEQPYLTHINVLIK